MEEKEQLRETRTAIRHILMSDWDPIGVSDTPEAADEYDSYIGGIYDLLAGGTTDRQLAQYLRRIETERMGLTDLDGVPLLPTGHRDAAVSALLRLDLSRTPREIESPKKVFRHWTLYSKFISPAVAKIQERRRQGICIGCGSTPCKCKNPKRRR